MTNSHSVMVGSRVRLRELMARRRRPAQITTLKSGQYAFDMENGMLNVPHANAERNIPNQPFGNRGLCCPDDARGISSNGEIRDRISNVDADPSTDLAVIEISELTGIIWGGCALTVPMQTSLLWIVGSS